MVFVFIMSVRRYPLYERWHHREMSVMGLSSYWLRSPWDNVGSPLWCAPNQRSASGSRRLTQQGGRPCFIISCPGWTTSSSLISNLCPREGGRMKMRMTHWKTENSWWRAGADYGEKAGDPHRPPPWCWTISCTWQQRYGVCTCPGCTVGGQEEEMWLEIDAKMAPGQTDKTYSINSIYPLILPEMSGDTGV